MASTLRREFDAQGWDTDACSRFSPTVKGNLCSCGFRFSQHTEDVRARFGEYRWGWRARLLAQPDSEECE